MALINVRRFGYSPSYTPPTPKATDNEDLCSAESRGPFRYRQALAIVFQIVRVCGIKDLLFSCGPAAVLWRVALVVVDAIKLQAIGTRPHISKEILKLQPAITNRDTATSIAMERPDIRVCASLQHPVPGVVLGYSLIARPAHAVSRATLSTSARAISLERFGVYYPDVSAIALTLYERAAHGCRHMLYNLKVLMASSNRWIDSHFPYCNMVILLSRR